MIDSKIYALCDYALAKGLIEADDYTWTVNRLLEVMGLDSIGQRRDVIAEPLEKILAALIDDAVSREVAEDSIITRDLFDTRLMGAITPAPHEVIGKFNELYTQSPRAATDWFYSFNQDVDYIRRYRISKDLKWKYECEYGTLDITINLSKPEKDPKDIARSKLAPKSGYPRCQLCPENVGYAGRFNHPARQNLRAIPIELGGSRWYFQYSPYVYYNEHCIVLDENHSDMLIDRSTFARLFQFISRFPHYFVGSNADLPIVGGSILTHEHFQGGRYEFAMERAEVETPVKFSGYEDIDAGIVKWPMSVIRLDGDEPEKLCDLADKILTKWRAYSDTDADIAAFTGDIPHNTITPIARRKNGRYELDLVLRNNRATDEYPDGIFHPHRNLHHIKKENIGLIEVMGLAVLPPRLNIDLPLLKNAILKNLDLNGVEELKSHADWINKLKALGRFAAGRPESISDTLKAEIGAVFVSVLEDAGVYKRDEKGKAAFVKFIDTVNE